MDLPKRTRFVVTCGAFTEEMSAIRYAELVSSKGFKATVSETDTDPTANITAALMLIAEQLNQINEKLDIFTKPAQQLQVVDSKWPARANTHFNPKEVPRGDLGSFLKTKRVAMEMTITQLAQRLGIGEYQIVRYEAGITKPRAKRLTELCTALDISNEDIQKYLHK